MSEREVYGRFIDWMNQTWWGLPEAVHGGPSGQISVMMS